LASCAWVATAATTYQERKEQSAETGVCLYPACHEPAASGSNWCAPHRDKERANQRESRARLRKRRKRLGQCIDCGVKLRRDRDERIYCAAHRVARNRLGALSRAAAVVQATVQKSERIASRTVRGDDGRTRYHGQERRGQQTHAQLDEQDIEFARREITAGEAGLKIYAVEVGRSKAKDPLALPRIQRDDLRSAALHQLDRAARHLGDVLERHGHAIKRHGRREGEE